MDKIVFFLYYRSGSTFFEALCGKGWRKLQYIGKTIQETNECYSKWRRSGKWFFLPTIPPDTCPSEDMSTSINDILKQGLPFNCFSWAYHIGDWWGQVKSDKIPLPYEDKSVMKWSKYELESLPGNHWSFVSLIRDGRNQIESLRNIKGGIEEKLNSADPSDYFKVLCKAFRNRARVALDCQALPNYKMFKFEDIIIEPIKTMNKMFEFVGLKLDVHKCEQSLQSIEKHKNTSFPGSKDNERWHNWTCEEIDVFKDIAGKELLELGYKW